MRILLFDGYIDEPASLGVRPFVHPLVRAAYGAAVDAGAEVVYHTVDQLRSGMSLPPADLCLALGGCSVPGRYLRSLPASARELDLVSHRFPGYTVLGGPAAIDPALKGLGFDAFAAKDPAAWLYDLILTGEPGERWRDLDEWNRWMEAGAPVVRAHPDYPQPLVAEMETYRGCIRYRGGGCSFCAEPLKGEPLFREVEDIVSEARALMDQGVKHLRMGAQSCFVSYQFREGPDPEAIDSLLSSMHDLGPDTLHLDNANPGVMADHPEEAGEILRSITRYCSPGNVLALGMESADPRVIEANNLNSVPEQVMEAIRMMNRVGRERGDNGMPVLLPGLNFLIGLDGESRRTLDLNLQFLREVREEGHLLRRINIRKVIPIRREFRGGVNQAQFRRFKSRVREEIDRPMLADVLPRGTVLRRIHTELRQGGNTFGRQIGTYPLLVGFNYHLPLERFVDAKVVDWGFRSVTAVEYPLPVNGCPISALTSIPGMGRKRATRIVMARPLEGPEDLVAALDDRDAARDILPYLGFGPG
ncbi:MAG: radical SAM protein [Methanomassiliicoccales archaeon]